VTKGTETAKSGTRIDRKRIALLHIARAQIGMSDEDYRAMLGSFGVASSVDLSTRQFAQVMDRMKAGGFEGRSDGPPGAPRIPSVETQKRRMIVKMDQVLGEIGAGFEYADGMARRMFDVEKVQWLEVGQLYKVLQALMIHRDRKKKTGESVSG
jgi:phage gp16-like protein